MNWLADVLRQINSCDRPEQHRNLLMIRAVDLSEICDRFVQNAPPPAVEVTETELRLSWSWASRARQIVVLVDRDGACSLQLSDGQRHGFVASPVFDQIKTSARSFFEGWEPHP